MSGQTRSTVFSRMHVSHIAVIVKLRHDTEGRALYCCKLGVGNTLIEALRCLKRSISDVNYRQLVRDEHDVVRIRESTAGRY